jgi:type IV pilus biogenesis protein CpaD/CtpE
MQSRVMLFSVEMLLSGALLISLEACAPRVEVAPSDKPITINLNVKIDHEIRLKVDKELDDVISKDSGLF